VGELPGFTLCGSLLGGSTKSSNHAMFPECVREKSTRAVRYAASCPGLGTRRGAYLGPRLRARGFPCSTPTSIGSTSLSHGLDCIDGAFKLLNQGYERRTDVTTPPAGDIAEDSEEDALLLVRSSVLSGGTAVLTNESIRLLPP